MIPHLRNIILLAALIGLPACSTVSPDAKPLSAVTATRQLIHTELYFGAVPLPEWNAFLDEEVTPRFPDGLSWFDVNGQWLGKSGRVGKLPSRVLIIIHEPTDAKNRAIDEIRTAFKAKFHHQSVLRVSFSAATSF